MDAPLPLSRSDAIAANLRVIVRGLLVALGAWRLEPVRAVVLYNRISGTIARLMQMLERFQAGRLRLRQGQRQATRLDAAPRPQARRAPVACLPRRWGWLVRAAGSEAACFGMQLQTVLTKPEMTALLAASAQARRIMRPLCRALALEVPMVATQPMADCGARKLRKRRPRTKPEPFRIPLPRGVLTAARRQGFGKLR